MGIENVGTRRAESGALSDAMEWARVAFDGVLTRHAVSVQFVESARAVIALKIERRDSACRVGGIIGCRVIWRVWRLMAFSHGTPCPYNLWNRCVP